MRLTLKFLFLIISLLNFHLEAATIEDLIQQYISVAADNSPELNAELRVYEASRTRLHQAGARLLPSIDFSSRYTRAGGGREFVFDLNPYGFPLVIRENFMREREHETKFTLTQPIFTGGGNYYSWRASLHQVKSSQYDLMVFEQKLYLDIIKAYTDLLTVSELVKSAESIVERATENLRVSSVKMMAGSAVVADTLRARAELALAKAELLVSKNRLQITRRDFLRILGTDEISVEFPDEIPQPEMDYINSSTIKTAAEEGLKSRPEISGIQASIRASSLARNAVRGSFLPSIYVAADYGWEGVDYKLNSEYDFWMVSGILRWNIFNGFGDKARWDERKLKTRELIYRKTALEDGIKMQVHAAATEYNNALTEWESARESFSAAEENYRIRYQLYENGTGSMLELMDSNELLSKAVAGEITSRYKVLYMKYKLNWAKGVNLREN